MFRDGKRRAEVLAGDAALESLTTAQDYDRRLGCCMMLCCLKAIDASERAGQYDYDNDKFEGNSLVGPVNVEENVIPDSPSPEQLRAFKSLHAL